MKCPRPVVKCDEDAHPGCEWGDSFPGVEMGQARGVSLSSVAFPDRILSSRRSMPGSCSRIVFPLFIRPSRRSQGILRLTGLEPARIYEMRLNPHRILRKLPSGGGSIH